MNLGLDLKGNIPAVGEAPPPAESVLGPEGGLDEILLSVLKDLLAF